ncbi:MAG: histidine phosphatase family protein [Ruminiclostridium sp.]|nr:histidine phosphatase family protein [Ruminiclostridium sp.]
MRLLIIRHGDPDYENDTLTAKGEREAELLADRVAPLDVKEYYCSPLGRARKTASYTLERAGRGAVICDWLREFDTVPVKDAETGKPRLAWDQLPAMWTNVREFYDKDEWVRVPMMSAGNMAEAVRNVTEPLDAVLSEHGYTRYGNFYLAEKPNSDTLVFFCHFGVSCVLIGHLLGISPMVLWHGAIALPTSVTTLCTEERREGIASFRMSGFGDISHLYAGGEEPSFSGRFCEMWTNTQERHD